MEYENIEDLIGFGTPGAVAAALSDGLFEINEIVWLGMTAVGIAIFHDNSEVAFMLMDQGADVSMCDRDQGGEPPVKIAYDRKNTAVFEALVEKGASLDEPGWMGISVAHRIKEGR